MHELRRFVLWLIVLLAPGGILLLPLLILEMGKNGFWRAGTRHA